MGETDGDEDEGRDGDSSLDAMHLFEKLADNLRRTSPAGGRPDGAKMLE